MSNSSIYNERYLGDYREHCEGFEIARWEALEHFITYLLQLGAVNKVLDYGAGSGLHVDLWEAIFPKADVSFCDISSVALKKIGLEVPSIRRAVPFGRR